MKREYKDSGISWVGSIPKEWDVLRNKNVFICGKELVGNESSTAQLLSLTTKGIKAIKPGETSGKVPDSYDTYQKVEPNNIVMCLFDLDCSAVFSGISKFNGMISPAYKVLSCRKNVFPDFANYWFIYVFDGRKFMHYSKNIRYSLTYDEFGFLKIAIPPFEEQIIIAEFLNKKCGEIDALIALQEQMISQLTDYKQSVITEAVIKGLNPNAELVPSGIDWIGEVPKSWNRCAPLKWFTEIILGKMLQSNANSPTDTLEKYICAKDVHFDGIDYSDLKSMYYSPAEKVNYQVHRGDMLVVEGGAGAAGAAIVDESIENTYIQNSIMIVRPKRDIDIRYARYVLFSIVSRGYVDYICNKATIPHFTKDKLSGTLIPMPSFDEQRDIAEHLDKKCSEIDKLIETKRLKIEKLKEYKKSVIYEAVTGKTVIK